MMAEIFSRLALMPRSEMIKPSSIPLGTPKTHFSGLDLVPFAWSFAKVCSRSATTWLGYLGLTTMSSTEASMVFLMRSLKYLSIQC